MNEKQVFICYAKVDSESALRLYNNLETCGLEPWIDQKNILPGQDWKIEIKKAIRKSRFFCVLLSSKSVNKIGYVQKEITDALDRLNEFPPGTIFLIPVRLDDCNPSHSKLKDIHWVDMFPSWKDGLEILKRAMGIVTGTHIMPTDSKRGILMQILMAGTKAYFTDITHAPMENKRQEAIEALHNTIKKPLITTIKMPEKVYDLYIEECIRSEELLDWDQWLTERLTNMADLPQELQQSMFDYGFTRLLDTME